MLVDTGDEDRVRLCKSRVIGRNEVPLPNGYPLAHFALDVEVHVNCDKMSILFEMGDILTGKDIGHDQMCPKSRLMSWIDIAIRQLIQSRFTLNLSTNGIDRKEDCPGQQPSGDEDLEHHPDETNEDVGI